MSIVFGYISGLLSAVAFWPYIVDILKKKTRPQRTSWLIWLILGSIAFLSQKAEGAGASLWMTGVQTLGVIIIFLLSIKYGVGGFTKKDFVCLCLAILGVVLWQLTDQAYFGLIFVILVDSIGALLTATKAYNDPESETLNAWLIAALAGVFGALAVGSFNIVLIAYPLYICLANAITVGAIIMGRRTKS